MADKELLDGVNDIYSRCCDIVRSFSDKRTQEALINTLQSSTSQLQQLNNELEEMIRKAEEKELKMRREAQQK